MPSQYSTVADAYTPEDFGGLVNLEVQAKSVLFRTARNESTQAAKVNFPVWRGHPVTPFYDELDTIAESEAETGEVTIEVHKTAGIHKLSQEIVDDSIPSVGGLTQSSLANQITHAIDKAYLGNTTPKGFDGLQSIDYSTVGAELGVGGYYSLDPFIAARFKAEAEGSKISSWIVSPNVAEALSKVKITESSNQNLLQFVQDGITIAGLPVLTSTYVDSGTFAWGIPREHVVALLRKGTEVVLSRDAAFYQDAVVIRAVARIGAGFLNEPGVVRITALAPLVYTLSFGGATGGSAVATVNGKPTSTIAYNATAATVKSAIVAVDDGIEASDVTVTGSAGGPYTVTVPGDVALSVNGAGLTGGTGASVTHA